jgi:hypothetical protein
MEKRTKTGGKGFLRKEWDPPLTGEVDSEGFSLVSLNPRGRLSTRHAGGTQNMQ